VVKFCLMTPVLSLVPGVHADWERDGTLDDVVSIAEAADRLGYDYLTCSEHVAVPTDGMDLPGPRYWDPLPTFGYLAARTTRIRLTTWVLVLPYHHPLEIAKRYGTLDRICGGRLNLGVAPGYLEQEFRVLGAPFEDRGPRTDDAIRALRASFGRSMPSYEGPYYRFENMVVDPCGVQQDIPIWIGGRTPRSLRRAVALGDGWCPFAISPRRAAQWLAAARETEAWEQRGKPLEVVLSTHRPLDPSGAPQETLSLVEESRDAGITTVPLRFVHHSLAHYLEQLEAMKNLITRSDAIVV
jgi:probable F420-dependent oxidoreductase